MRSKATRMACFTARSVTVTPRRPAACTAAKGATPGRRAISPSQIDFGPSGLVSIAPCASDTPMPSKPSGSTPINSVEGDR